MGADANTVRNQYAIRTTDNTPTNIASFPIYTGQVLSVQATISAQRKSGSSGTAGDSAGFTISGVFKNPSGTASIIGGLSIVANKDNASWDATITTSGTLILIQVTGDTGNDIDWACVTKVVKAI